jgi:hypothetical protein
MIHTKSLFGYGVTAVVIVVAAITVLSTDTAMNAYAQNMTTPPPAQQNQTADPQQIKNYLAQAIQALDSGNNTKAAEQIGLAEEQLEGTGTEIEDEDEEGEVEGEVEDEDEPGEEETP